MGAWWGDIYKRFSDLERAIEEDERAKEGSFSGSNLKSEYKQRDDMLSMYKSLIGRNLVSIRTRLNLTLRDVAEKCDVAPSTILRCEKDKSEYKYAPKYEILSKIVSVFNDYGEDLTVSDLLKDDYLENEGFKDVILTPGERIVLQSMDKLNDEGKRVAGERVEELSKIPDYQKEDV